MKELEIALAFAHPFLSFSIRSTDTVAMKSCVHPSRITIFQNTLSDLSIHDTSSLGYCRIS
jgi:hypothetical protein